MIIGMLAMLAAQTGSPTSPPNPADSADARCIVIFGFLGSRGDANQAQQSQLATMYYVGKLRAQTPSLNVARTIEDAAAQARTGGVSARAEGQRCGAEFEAAAQSLRGVRPSPSPSEAPTKP